MSNLEKYKNRIEHIYKQATSKKSEKGRELYSGLAWLVGDLWMQQFLAHDDVNKKLALEILAEEHLAQLEHDAKQLSN